MAMDMNEKKQKPSPMMKATKNQNVSGLKPTGQKETLTHKAGEMIEKAGKKIRDAGAEKVGKAIYNAGNKIEHSQD